MKKLSLTLAAAAVAALSLSLTACEKVTNSMRGMSSMTHMTALTAITSRRDYPTPVEQTSYSPNDPAYVRYVTERTGTDTHTYKTGDRAFVMRGTPPLQGDIEPWYDWNDMGNVATKPVSFNDCGKCDLAMGAEMVVKTENLKGHSLALEICYFKSKKDMAPQCFRGDTLPLAEDLKDWKKMSVTVPFEQFRTIAYRNARLRLLVDGGKPDKRNVMFGKAGFEGVVWADEFRFLLAEQKGGDTYNVKLSGALWPDDYAGWDTGMGKPRDPLQAWKR